VTPPAPLGPLLADPGAAAVLCDLDGTLAPIAPRPEGAAIPKRARDALERISERYATMAIVTGRRALDGREIVGLDGLTYAGIHGFELLGPGDARPHPAPALAGLARDAPRFAAGLDRQRLTRAGLRLEEKGPIVALHWRGAEREEEARAAAERIGEEARAQGLVTHPGRKVLELRPAVEIDKGTAVTTLVADAGVRAAMYAGDDRTDLDAFRALGELQQRGLIDHAVRVGVRSQEGPAEIAAEADLVVDDPDALLPILEALAR